MRILALTNLYPNCYQPNRATFNRHRLRLLAERHAVRVIAPIAWTDERKALHAGAYPLPHGRQVEKDGMTVDHPRYWYTPKAFRSWYGRFYQWSVQSVFRRAVSEFKPDIVFTPWAYPDGWAAVQLACRNGLPAVLQVHGSDVRLVDDFRGRAKGTTEAVRLADGVIAVSQELAERVVRLGAMPERTRVIIDGVDRKLFQAGDQKLAQKKLGLRQDVKHLLFVGNLVAVKGLDILLEACARISNHATSWELHLIGEGNMRAQLVEQVTRNDLRNRVQFHGGLPHDQLPDWFRAADLFLLASRSEGTPTVLLEAASCGLPFVATAVGGIPAMEGLGSCKLVPSEDSERFARAMVEMLDTPRHQSAKGPRDHQEAVAELEEFLHTVVARYRKNQSHSQTESRSLAG